MKARRLNAVTRILLAIFAMMLFPQGTWAQDVDYYVYNTTNGSFDKTTLPASEVKSLPASTNNGATVGSLTISEGTYVVSSGNPVSYSQDHVVISGEVNIILCDGATLTAAHGIEVGLGAVLNIYGQEKGTGVLNATGVEVGTAYRAAIGSVYSYMASRVVNRAPNPKDPPQINIHGGQITANSSGTDYCAGIGGAYGSFSGSVTIYGGKVTATGGQYSAGIGGGGIGAAGCTVSIYGGEVIASGGDGKVGNNNYGLAMGIGAGSPGAGAAAPSNGQLTLGGSVTGYGGTTSSNMGALNQTSDGGYIRSQYMKTETKYDLWVQGTRVTSANASDIGGKGAYLIDISFSPASSTLYYKSNGGGGVGQSVNSGLQNLTIKIGSPENDDYLKNNIGIIKFGSPDGTPITATSGNLILSKEDGVSGVQQFAIVGSGSEPSIIQGFDNVTYDDFVILENGAKYSTSNKRLEDSKGNGLDGIKSGSSPVTFVTPDGIKAPTMSHEDGYGYSELVLTNNMSIGTLTYNVDYAADKYTDITDKTYDGNNKPQIDHAATVTAYVTINGVKSNSVIGKYFEYSGEAVEEYAGTDKALTAPGIVPTIDDTDGVGVAYNINGVYTSVQVNAGAASGLMIKDYGSSEVDATFTPSATTPYTILNSFGSASFWARIVPPAATISYDEKKEHKNSDDLEITSTTGSPILYTWDNTVTLAKGDLVVLSSKPTVYLYDPTNRPKLQSGTVRAWAAYVEDGGYFVSDVVAQPCSVKIDISNYYVATIESMPYTGSAVTPTITVKESATGATLAQNTDYTVKYEKGGAAATLINADTYDVIIEGKGIYAGSITNKTFTIAPKAINDASISVTVNGTYVYTGVAVEPPTTNIIVQDGTKTLTYDTDYTISYNNNVAAGTAAEVIITGKDNYDSNTKFVKKFTINKADMTGIQATGYTGDYDGAGHGITVTAPAGATVKYGTDANSCTDTRSPEYKDYRETPYTVYYQVSQANYNTVKGSQTVTINKRSLSGASISPVANETYNGNPYTPEPDVTLVLIAGNQTTKLVKGTDYTLAYENNTNAGTATVKVIGANNFKDEASTTFTINKATLAAFSVSIADWPFASTASTPQVSGNLGKGNVTYQYKVKGADDATYSEYDPATAGKYPTAVNTYTLKATVAETANYKSATYTVDFSITASSATVDFGTRKYKTFYNAANPFLVPANVKAYIVTGVSGNTVTLKQVSYIKAGVPVLLESSSGATTVSDPNEVFTGNLLKYGAGAAGQYDYVLYNNEFVKATGDLTGKVYLDATGLVSNARTLVIGSDENATGLDALFNEEGDEDQWFDMQGRKINKPTKAGLYIKNGQKVVIKNK